MRTELTSNFIYQDCALQVAQQGVSQLLQWIDNTLTHPFSLDIQSQLKAVKRAKEILQWDDSSKIAPLRLLFDQVCLSERQPTTEPHYHLLIAITNADPRIPYPLTYEPNEEEQEEFKQAIKTEILSILQEPESCQNLSLLMLILEKYGSCLSFGKANVALVDQVRMTAAIAAALANDPDASQVSLIAGGLSGIQKFIYTISSDGALKSLRARSFYLELVTEEVVQQLLSVLGLPRTSVIYAGGSNLYLLAPDGVAATVKTKCQELNRWLRAEFQGKISLEIATQTFAPQDAGTVAFRKTWQTVIKQVNQQKTQRLAEEVESQITEIFQPKESHTPCKVCHRSDQRKLQRLNRLDLDSVLSCSTCARMFRLGGQLMRVDKIVRSHRWLSDKRLRFKLPSGNVYYNLYNGNESIPELGEQETLFLINNWNLNDSQEPNAAALLLGNYGIEGQAVERDNRRGFMQASEFAEMSGGIKRVGYLRMDVDRLGQIFAKGLGDDDSLPKLAGLSRQMSYFFKVYLNSLAEHRNENFLQKCGDDSFKVLTRSDREKLLFIYAGGDDLFISGSWNEVVEFAFDVYQAFRAYTGDNPDITLSGGISLEMPKFPLYQAAELAGEAEDKAKANGRDSLGLFGAVFKWSEWLGTVSLEDIAEKTQGYLAICDRPPFLGVWDFVALLQGQLVNHYKQSFVRNLLLTAQIQEQQLEEKKKAIHQYRKDYPNVKEADAAIKTLNREVHDIRYYLHLPKVAYTLARLSPELRQREEFKPMRISLLSPYNAPYFRTIATWIELLTRGSQGEKNE
jgi:CRISPR-associated protein Csm1